MAIQTVATKSGPARPPVAPAKPVPVPSTPVAATKPAPAKPSPAKPITAAAKPAAAPPAAAPSAYASKAEFDAFKKELAEWSASISQGVEALANRIQELEIAVSGHGPHVSADASGNVVLDLENAPDQTIREWSYQFEVVSAEDALTADAGQIRALLIQTRDTPGFAGWEIKYELPIPGSPVTQGVAPAAAPVAEEGQEISVEQINKMNWAELTPIADQLGLDYSAISTPPQPKVLRNAIIEQLTAMNAAEAAPPANGSAEQPQLVEGQTQLVFEHEGMQYSGIYTGVDADGDCMLKLADGQDAAVPFAIVNFA